ncbi:MAG: putative porin [Candidatus Latescibacterota bacterium]
MKHSVPARVVLAFAVLFCIPATSFSQAPANPVTLRGDLRFRHETIDPEDAGQRNLERIRARVNLSARLPSRVNIVLGLATGSSNEPASANQTLTGGFSDKPLWLGLAYLDWAPAGRVRFLGGKMRNPFFQAGRNQLIWDQDMNPEGFALQLSQKIGAGEVFANSALFLVEERATGDDSYMRGGQFGVRAGSGVNVTLGAAYFDFANSRGVPSFFSAANSFGNAVDSLNTYRYGFRVAELFGEIGFPRFPGSPLLYADLVTNTADGAEDNNGWIAGATLGRLGAPGSWAIRYAYERLEANAVVGAFTNSDFIGGGANGQGHIFGLDLQLSGQTAGSLTYYLNERGIDSDIEYHRFQADLNFRF